MNAIERLRKEVTTPSGLAPLRVLAASGQLGYGVPDAAFNAGLGRKPHLIGADMGSIDPGPYYLGAGKMATAESITRVDLRKLMVGKELLLLHVYRKKGLIDPKHKHEAMCHKWGWFTKPLVEMVESIGMRDVQVVPARYHFPFRDMRIEAIK